MPRKIAEKNHISINPKSTDNNEESNISRLLKNIDLNKSSTIYQYSTELNNTLATENKFQCIRNYEKYIEELNNIFKGEIVKTELRNGHHKKHFIYMLIDSGITKNLPDRAKHLKKFEIWKEFISSIFYVGNGKGERPYDHLAEAKRKINQNNANNPKISRIVNIWKRNDGVICLHVFHNIVSEDAYTREAAIISAIGLIHLSNKKLETFYRDVKLWSERKKNQLGVALLYKAMNTYLNEGEYPIYKNDI